MKRFCAFLLFFVSLAFLWFLNYSTSLGGYAVQKTYASFSSSAPKDAGGKNLAFNLTKCGEEFTAEKDFDYSAFLDGVGAKVVFCEQVEGRTVIYAYSPRLKYFVKIGGKRVNVNISLGERVVVATPLIFGSF